MGVRLRWLLVAGTVLLATSSAWGFVPRSGPRIAADTLTAVDAQKQLRSERRLDFAQKPSVAWSRLAATGNWQAAYDVATGVPVRIWGSFVSVPGAMANSDVAEQAARQFLADNLDLLAPGAQLSDFVLVSNVNDGNIRAIGFAQYSGGIRVIGGQVSFEFKNDRLFVVGSEALPNVAASVPRSRLSAAALRSLGVDRLRSYTGLVHAPIGDPGEEQILPLIADDGILGYKLVRRMTINGGPDGAYEGYVDAITGALVAIRETNLYATATVAFHTVNRYPGRGYVDRPAPRAHVTVNGGAETTSQQGGIVWSPDTTASLGTAPDGDLVTIVNKAAMGVMATAMMSIDPGGTTVWDASSVKENDSQLNTYIALNTVKEHTRNELDPNMMTLDDQITGNVNIAQDCNAYFDGTNVNFFHASSMCENTGEIEDVVFHEYGHRIHTAEIIDGVGAFDGAMSEGAADFNAVNMTNDSGMGRGFFYNDQPLRELDPPNSEWMWPQDIQEIHHTGMIFGGAFWDLRKALIAKYGMTAGVSLVEKLYIGALRRSVDIPSSLIEVLATDDDDGDLSNGTPNECLIRDAFGRHGLRTVSGNVEAPGTLETDALSIGVIINVTGLSPRCDGDALAGAGIDWKPLAGPTPTTGFADADPAGTNRFFVELPLAPQLTVLYRITIKFLDGSTFVLADNRADPYYQLYQGRTVPLYCTDFETDPFADGWTTGNDDGLANPWQWGVPSGGATDPHMAFSGTHILAQGLGTDYQPKSHSWVETPEIDVGRYTDVRLQYRRWLGVEDSHFDQAQVLANGTRAWMNFDDGMGDNAATQHVDKEWRFHDVPLSPYFMGHTVKVRWDLKADEGLQFGGWQLDDVCIVANPNSVCGDGVKTSTEQCDNGAMNADLPNLCRTDCRLPTCGDSIIDMGEQCDDGSAGSPECSNKCKTITIDAGGCCSGSGGSGSVILALFVGLVIVSRGGRGSRKR